MSEEESKNKHVCDAVLSINTVATFLQEEGVDIMLISELFGPHAPPEPPKPIKHTIPTYSTAHNKNYRNIFSNVDSDSDSDSVDGSNVQPYVRPDKTTSSRSRDSRQLSVKSAAFRVKLQKASKNVPKYLFRIDTSRLPPQERHKSVYDMTFDEFIRYTEALVVGAKSPPSEFSSWTQLPHFAFNYAMHLRRMYGNNKTIHVTIMDTEALAESNPAFNVAVLHETFPNDIVPNYHEEYLVHGIFQGPSYMAVPFRQLCSAGLLKHLPSITQSSNPLGAGGLTPRLSPNFRPFKADDFSKLMDITRLCGKNFVLPFAVTRFCSFLYASVFF